MSDVFTFGDTEAKPALTGYVTEGRLAAIVDYDGSDAFIWSYTLVVNAPSRGLFKIMGRRWTIEWGATVEHVPDVTGRESSIEDRYLPTFAGGRPLMLPGRQLLFKSALVIDADEIPTISGDLRAIDLITGSETTVIIEPFTFERGSTAETIKTGITKLSPPDAAKLTEAVHRYQNAVARDNAALLRIDRLGLSPEGRLLVELYLIYEFRSEYKKNRLINFASLIDFNAENHIDLMINSTDHYICQSNKYDGQARNKLQFTYVISYNFHEMVAEFKSDAEAEQLISDLVDGLGLEAVAVELLKRASPEQRAWLAREAQPEQVGTNHLAPAASALTTPHLSDEELAEFKTFAAKEENIWQEGMNLSPSAHIETYFQSWLSKGLKIEHIEEAQPQLVRGYKDEIKRNPRKRIRAITRPHKKAPDDERPISTRRAAELTSDQLDQRRKFGRERKAKSDAQKRLHLK